MKYVLQYKYRIYQDWQHQQVRLFMERVGARLKQYAINFSKRWLIMTSLEFILRMFFLSKSIWSNVFCWLKMYKLYLIASNICNFQFIQKFILWNSYFWKRSIWECILYKICFLWVLVKSSRKMIFIFSPYPIPLSLLLWL